MSRRQLFALFCASLFPWTLGSGLLPLLPVYARELGASSTVAGLYLGLASVSLVAMTAVTNSLGAAWLTDLVSPEVLSRGMSLSTGVSWAAGIIGFSGAGAALQRLGVLPTAGLAMALVVLAGALVGLIRDARPTFVWAATSEAGGA